MRPKADTRVLEELARCLDDHYRFCSYLKIVSKGDELPDEAAPTLGGLFGRVKLVSLEPNFSQAFWDARAANAQWTITLKSRKEGLSTWIASHGFRRSFLMPEHGTLVVSEIDKSALRLFTIYKRFYDNLPEAFKRAVPLVECSKTHMRFAHGGHIECSSAQSGFRGDTKHFLHFSELAFYTDIGRTADAAFNVAADSASVHVESTAFGINEFYRLWFGDTAYRKIFVPWQANPENVQRGRLKDVPPEFESIRREHRLADQQLVWALNKYRTKCRSNWTTFRQEYPLDPVMAFVASGDRFFTTFYHDGKVSYGHRQLAPKIPGHVYTMGVDTASGSKAKEADNSTWCILDVTDPKHITIASTFYGKADIPTFCSMLYDEGRAYDALAVVEANSYGLSVIEYLVAHQYPYMYVNQKAAKMADRYSTTLGFWSGLQTKMLLLARIQEDVSRGWFEPDDERLKYEMNVFTYAETGLPRAKEGEHDDLVIATALALYGRDQVSILTEERENFIPATIEELIKYEVSTGLIAGKDFMREPRLAPIERLVR